MSTGLDGLKLTRIVTHNDFDGVISAAICSHALKIQKFFFTGPLSMTGNQVMTTAEDVVCDLPYPLRAGAWFDHHEGNLGELKLRKIDPVTIPGRYSPELSCSRIVYEFFGGRGKFPDFYEEMVNDADMIDSFGYKTIEEWRSETPAKLVDSSIKYQDSQFRNNLYYLENLVLRVREEPFEKVVSVPEVFERIKLYRAEEDKIIELMRKESSFMADDQNKEIIVLDLCHFNRKPFINKNLAFILNPDSLGVLVISNLFQKGVKSNNISFSMSLSITMNNTENNKDIGEIMRTLNIGDGHKGAASGTIRCASKNEMLKRKKETMDRIFSIWRSQ